MRKLLILLGITLGAIGSAFGADIEVTSGESIQVFYNESAFKGMKFNKPFPVVKLSNRAANCDKSLSQTGYSSLGCLELMTTPSREIKNVNGVPVEVDLPAKARTIINENVQIRANNSLILDIPISVSAEKENTLGGEKNKWKFSNVDGNYISFNATDSDYIFTGKYRITVKWMKGDPRVSMLIDFTDIDYRKIADQPKEWASFFDDKKGVVYDNSPNLNSDGWRISSIDAINGAVINNEVELGAAGKDEKIVGFFPADGDLKINLRKQGQKDLTVNASFDAAQQKLTVGKIYQNGKEAQGYSVDFGWIEKKVDFVNKNDTTETMDQEKVHEISIAKVTAPNNNAGQNNQPTVDINALLAEHSALMMQMAPYQISDAEGLKWFVDKISFNTSTQGFQDANLQGLTMTTDGTFVGFLEEGVSKVQVSVGNENKDGAIETIELKNEKGKVTLVTQQPLKINLDNSGESYEVTLELSQKDLIFKDGANVPYTGKYGVTLNVLSVTKVVANTGTTNASQQFLDENPALLFSTAEVKGVKITQVQVIQGGATSDLTPELTNTTREFSDFIISGVGIVNVSFVYNQANIGSILTEELNIDLKSKTVKAASNVPFKDAQNEYQFKFELKEVQQVVFNDQNKTESYTAVAYELVIEDVIVIPIQNAPNVSLPPIFIEDEQRFIDDYRPLFEELDSNVQGVSLNQVTFAESTAKPSSLTLNGTKEEPVGYFLARDTRNLLTKIFTSSTANHLVPFSLNVNGETLEPEVEINFENGKLIDKATSTESDKVTIKHDVSGVVYEFIFEIKEVSGLTMTNNVGASQSIQGYKLVLVNVVIPTNQNTGNTGGTTSSGIFDPTETDFIQNHKPLFADTGSIVDGVTLNSVTSIDTKAKLSTLTLSDENQLVGFFWAEQSYLSSTPSYHEVTVKLSGNNTQVDEKMIIDFKKGKFIVYGTGTIGANEKDIFPVNNAALGSSSIALELQAVPNLTISNKANAIQPIQGYKLVLVNVTTQNQPTGPQQPGQPQGPGSNTIADEVIFVNDHPPVYLDPYQVYQGPYNIGKFQLGVNTVPAKKGILPSDVAGNYMFATYIGNGDDVHIYIDGVAKEATVPVKLADGVVPVKVKDGEYDYTVYVSIRKHVLSAPNNLGQYTVLQVWISDVKRPMTQKEKVEYEVKRAKQRGF